MNKQLIAALVLALGGGLGSTATHAIIMGNGGTENGRNLNGGTENGRGGNGKTFNGREHQGLSAQGREHQGLSAQGHATGAGMKALGSNGSSTRVRGQDNQTAVDQSPNLIPRLDVVPPPPPSALRWIELRNGVKYMLD